MQRKEVEKNMMIEDEDDRIVERLRIDIGIANEERGI
jgi:hypothetical protein